MGIPFLKSKKNRRGAKEEEEEFEEADIRIILRRLFTYSLKYKRRLLIGLCLGIIGGGAIYPLLENLEDLLSKVFNPERSTWTKVIMVSLLFPLIGVIKGICSYISVIMVNSVGYRVVTELRNECFRKMQYQSLGHINRSKAGEFISRITNDTTVVQQAVSSALSDLFLQPFMLIAVFLFLLRNHLELSFIVFIVVPVCVLPVAILGKHVKRYSRQNQAKLAGMVSILTENIAGASIVRAYRTEQHEQDKFEKESESVYTHLMRIIYARALSQPIMEIITMIGLSIGFIYVFKSQMKPEDFIGFATAVVLMHNPIRRLSKVHMVLSQAAGAAERVFELLDAPNEVEDRADAVVFNEPIRTIEYKNVSFDYGDDPILKSINLKVKAGQIIAFVGATGSGKTTLVNLLPRFYDLPEGKGEILVNGKDVRSFTLESLRGQTGLVTQDTFLFNDTIAANIAYGDSLPDMNRIVDAAKQANAFDFIAEKPDGFETTIGDRGMQLSGGQRQRLALARALYRNAPILILDEATSALDTQSERLVQEAIDHVMAGRTVFAIAHRLSTIQHADRIFVLQNGEIIEQGTHSELIDMGGHYEQLHSLQFQT